MPDLGIGEGLAALFGGGDLLAGLFGGGAAAADVAGAAAASPALASGLEAIAAPSLGFESLVGSGLAGTGADVLGTAGSFLAAPEASALGAGALTAGIGGAAADAALSEGAATGLASGTGGITSAVPTSLESLAGAGFTPSFTPTAVGGATALSPSVANANAAAPGASVFQTGTSPIAGVASSPSIAPAGGGAAAGAAPVGVSAPVDASAGIPGAVGPTSVGGAPLGASPPSSIESLLGKAGTGAIDSLLKNPLGVALGAGGLGYNIFKGQQQTANQKALSADAAQATANSNQMVASGEALQQYLTSGTLPPQYMTQVQQAIQDAKTAAISNAAAQGQSTDPNQNTSLATTLAKIEAQQPAMISQVASQLFSSGTSLVNSGQAAAGLSGDLYKALIANDTAQAANTGKAIATLAAALNGRSQASSPGVGGTTISIG